MRRSAVAKFTTVLSILAGLAFAPAIASAATPAQCSNITAGQWTTSNGSLGNSDIVTYVIPNSARTRFCLSAQPSANLAMALERKAYSGGDWQLVQYAKATDYVNWTFDADTDRHAQNQLWMFRILIRPNTFIFNAGYKLAWRAL